MHSATQEQIHGLGSNPSARRRFRQRFDADENAYHVISSCVPPEYTLYHDRIVVNVLKSIQQGTSASDHAHARLPFGKASIVTEYMWRKKTKIKIFRGELFEQSCFLVFQSNFVMLQVRCMPLKVMQQERKILFRLLTKKHFVYFFPQNRMLCLSWALDPVYVAKIDFFNFLPFSSFVVTRRNLTLVITKGLLSTE